MVRSARAFAALLFALSLSACATTYVDEYGRTKTVEFKPVTHLEVDAFGTGYTGKYTVKVATVILREAQRVCESHGQYQSTNTELSVFENSRGHRNVRYRGHTLCVY